MRRISVLAFTACAGACALFPTLGDLTDDGGAADGSFESSPPDAFVQDAFVQDSSSPDSTSDASCPTITRVQVKSVSATSLVKTVSVTASIAQGDLIVAVLGAQFPGGLAISDSANNTWNEATGAENLNCVNDASPYGTRARVSYAFASGSVANDIFTFTNTTDDFLTLTLVEYATSGTLTFGTYVTRVADASSNTPTLPPMTTSGCRNVAVAMVADEAPSGDTWTPLPGFEALATQGDWSFVAIDDIDAAAGSIVAGASHPTTDSCWALAGATFGAQ